MPEIQYDVDQARRAILSKQIMADCFEDRAAELRELADDWERRAHNLRIDVLALADRLAQDGYRPPAMPEARARQSECLDEPGKLGS